MILKILVCVFLSVGIFFKTQHFIIVVGDSMTPSYNNGDILFATSFFRAKNLKVGDVMVFRPPIASSDEVKFVIKRISHIIKNTDGKLYFYFLGDNQAVSFDSRRYGYVPKDRLVAKVIRKL